MRKGILPWRLSSDISTFRKDFAKIMIMCSEILFSCCLRLRVFAHGFVLGSRGEPSTWLPRGGLQRSPRKIPRNPIEMSTYRIRGVTFVLRKLPFNTQNDQRETRVKINRSHFSRWKFENFPENFPDISFTLTRDPDFARPFPSRAKT